MFKTKESIDNKELVYNIILDYLHQNRPFKMKEILSYLNSRLAKGSININNAGIKKILISLANQQLFVEGSVLIKNELLENRKRNRIFSIIQDNPGILFNDIVKKSQFSNYIIYWHLEILTRFDCVRTAMIGKRQIFFLSSITSEIAEFAYHTRKVKSKQIIQYLKKNSHGVSKNQISKKLNMHYNTVTKYLETLEAIKLIEKKRNKNKTLYFLKNDNILL